MPNPARQEFIDAHNALKKLGHMAWNGSEDMYDKRLCALWKKQILAALPPKPRPTMAEVEWGDDKHYLAEAEHSAWGKVIMLNKAFTSGDIRALINEDGAISIGCITPKYLTPTGKRYELKEIQE